MLSPKKVLDSIPKSRSSPQKNCFFWARVQKINPQKMLVYRLAGKASFLDQDGNLSNILIISYWLLFFDQDGKCVHLNIQDTASWPARVGPLVYTFQCPWSRSTLFTGCTREICVMGHFVVVSQLINTADQHNLFFPPSIPIDILSNMLIARANFRLQTPNPNDCNESPVCLV
jgi:hypothetical protein